MDINTGQGQELFGNRAKRFRVREMPVGGKEVVRIIQGVGFRSFHMWPTIVPDESQVMKPTWRSAFVEEGVDTPLSILGNFDKEIKKKFMQATKQDPSKARSMFSPSKSYLYAVIRRTADVAGVEVMEALWSIVEDITNNRKATCPPPDNNKLMHGLSYMYDTIIEKGTHAKTGQNQYTATPYRSPVQGQIDRQHLDEINFPVANPGQFFTPADLELITACEWNIEDIDKPEPVSKLIEKLNQFPIDLGRRKKDQTGFIYFNNGNELGALRERLEQETISFMLPDANDMQAINAMGTGNIQVGVGGFGAPPNNATPQIAAAPIIAEAVVTDVAPIANANMNMGAMNNNPAAVNMNMGAGVFNPNPVGAPPVNFAGNPNPVGAPPVNFAGNPNPVGNPVAPFNTGMPAGMPGDPNVLAQAVAPVSSAAPISTANSAGVINPNPAGVVAPVNNANPQVPPPQTGANTLANGGINNTVVW